MYKHFFKRIFDFSIAFIALLLIGWLLAVVAVWLHYANKGAGAWFLQERPGKDAKIFKVIKFKTMTDERDAEGNLLPDEQRLTKVGRFVRSTSIDELPQLINVLKGDMSLIGPRPLLVQYLPLYSKEQARRHEVRPGISGWAQCHGRNAISWEEKFNLDVWYVDHCSLWTDIQVILTTIKNVLLRKDISSATSSTMEVFMGNIEKNQVYLYGASGHARVIKDILSTNGITVPCLIDDNKEQTELDGIKVIHDAKGLSPFIISIGNCKIRKMIVEKLGNVDFAKAIHPHAIIANDVKIGCGSVVMAGSVIQTGSVIGEHTIVNTGASIDHDCRVNAFVHIAPHCTLCGNVTVGTGTWIGAGTTVIQGITIGEGSFIGAGSVVVNDIPSGVLCYGNPARIIRNINQDAVNKSVIGGGNFTFAPSAASYRVAA